MAETDPEIERCVNTPPLNCSELDVSELPTGTVTLLLADVEGSTRLWQTQPDEMSAAVARLDRALSDLVAARTRVASTPSWGSARECNSPRKLRGTP
jgi:hypothetical protein